MDRLQSPSGLPNSLHHRTTTTVTHTPQGSQTPSYRLSATDSQLQTLSYRLSATDSQYAHLLRCRLYCREKNSWESRCWEAGQSSHCEGRGLVSWAAAHPSLGRASAERGEKRRSLVSGKRTVALPGLRWRRGEGAWFVRGKFATGDLL